jgi:hypothetical protein
VFLMRSIWPANVRSSLRVQYKNQQVNDVPYVTGVDFGSNVTYLLKVRNEKQEKRPLLSNVCAIPNNGVNV